MTVLHLRQTTAPPPPPQSHDLGKCLFLELQHIQTKQNYENVFIETNVDMYCWRIVLFDEKKEIFNYAYHTFSQILCTNNKLFCNAKLNQKNSSTEFQSVRKLVVTSILSIAYFKLFKLLSNYTCIYYPIHMAYFLFYHMTLICP